MDSRFNNFFRLLKNTTFWMEPPVSIVDPFLRVAKFDNRKKKVPTQKLLRKLWKKLWENFVKNLN